MGSTLYARVSIHGDRSTDMVFKCSLMIGKAISEKYFMELERMGTL